jgi:hypothetical protein
MRTRHVAQQRRRAEEQPVDDGEHGRICADAQPKCDDDGRGKSGASAEAADCITKIVANSVEQGCVASVALARVGKFDAFEPRRVDVAQSLGHGAPGVIF